MKLKRKEVAKMFYGKHTDINIKNKDNVINYLNKLDNYLDNYEYESNPDFVFCGRKKFIYDEIVEIINGTQLVDNPLYFVLGSLEEFISNNNDVRISDSIALGMNWNDLRDINDRYISTGVLCLEELEIIRKIIKMIINKLGGLSVDKEIIAYIPESLRDFVYVYNGDIYVKQKLPKELEEEYKTYCKLFEENKKIKY